MTKGPRVKMMRTAERFRGSAAAEAATNPTSPAVSALGSPVGAASRTPPEEFLCPISHEMMEDPVMVMATGMTYERAIIEMW